MDLLEIKNNGLLQRLRELRAQQCCLHINRQIGIWHLENLPQLQPHEVQQIQQQQQQQQQQQLQSLPQEPSPAHLPLTPTSQTQEPQQQQNESQPPQHLQHQPQTQSTQPTPPPPLQLPLPPPPPPLEQLEPPHLQLSQEDIKPLHLQQAVNDVLSETVAPPLDHLDTIEETIIKVDDIDIQPLDLPSIKLEEPPAIDEIVTATTPAEPIQRDPNASDEKTIGCFLSNLRHLEELDSDATESTSSNESYDELEGFSLEDIPPKRFNLPPTSKYPQTQTHHRASTSSLNSNQNNATHQRRASHQPNRLSNSDSTDPNNLASSNSHFSDIRKKAIWKWARERSRLAAKWTWLQAQIADLEFRVRGQAEALHYARSQKTSPLPPVLPEGTCSRTVPISKEFTRRRLIRSSQIIADSSKKSVKLSNVPCVCCALPQTVAPCLSCNGRYNYVKQLEGENMPLFERVSLLDPGCHPVLSLPDEVTLGSQLSYLLKHENVNRKPTKGKPGRKKGSTAAALAANAAAAAAAAAERGNFAKPGRKPGKYYPGMVGRPPGSTSSLKNASHAMIASNKLKRKYRKHSTNANNYESNNWYAQNNHAHSKRRNKRIRSASSMNDSSLHSESSNQYRPNHFSNAPGARNVSRRRRSEQSAYDIDNIVIPFSVAATTRVEILEYKEIMTPSWRVCDDSVSQNVDNDKDGDTEDISDEAYILRHSKGESEEKKRFSLKPPQKKEDTTILSSEK